MWVVCLFGSLFLCVCVCGKAGLSSLRVTHKSQTMLCGAACLRGRSGTLMQSEPEATIRQQQNFYVHARIVAAYLQLSRTLKSVWLHVSHLLVSFFSHLPQCSCTVMIIMWPVGVQLPLVVKSFPISHGMVCNSTLRWTLFPIRWLNGDCKPS